MRKMICCANLQLTQGAIFNNVIAEEYGGADVNGIIINARCDLAHEKKTKISYLPIVSLKDWETVDGRVLALNHIISDYKKVIQDKLIKQNRAISAIDYLGINDLKKLLKNDAKALQMLNKYFSAKNIISNDDIKTSEEIKEDYDKSLKNQKKELIKYRLNGYYFIESINGNDDPGYVALMNEIKYMPSIYAERIKRGFVPDDEMLKAGVFVEKEHTALMSNMVSPYIEHLVQQFSNMFTRVGVQEVEEVEKYIQ